MNEVHFDEIVPILRCFDEAKTREFYVDFLGFGVDWEHRFEEGLPLYMQVSRGGMILHLSGHHGDACPGAKVFVWMKGVKEFHQELVGKQYRNLRPAVEKTFYEAWCMELIDPFGNRLSFNERCA